MPFINAGFCVLMSMPPNTTVERSGKMLAIGFYTFFHLYRQFARGCQYQRADRVTGRGSTGTGIRQQALQQRQGERGRLTGTGLCHCHQVVPRQYMGDGFFLYRSRFSVTLFLDRFYNKRVEVECSEGHGGSYIFYQCVFQILYRATGTLRTVTGASACWLGIMPELLFAIGCCAVTCAIAITVTGTLIRRITVAAT